MSFIEIDTDTGTFLAPVASVGRITLPGGRNALAVVHDTEGRRLGTIIPDDAASLAGTVVPATPGWSVARVYLAATGEAEDRDFVDRLPVVAWRVAAARVVPVTPSWQANAELREGLVCSGYLLLPPEGRALDLSGDPCCDRDDADLIAYVRGHEKALRVIQAWRAEREDAEREGAA